jgi:hypothetical protein
MCVALEGTRMNVVYLIVLKIQMSQSHQRLKNVWWHGFYTVVIQMDGCDVCHILLAEVNRFEDLNVLTRQVQHVCVVASTPLYIRKSAVARRTFELIGTKLRCTQRQKDETNEHPPCFHLVPFPPVNKIEFTYNLLETM